MNKECPNCKYQMKQIGNEIYVGNSAILKQKGDGYLYKDTYGNVKAYEYVCFKCGLIQKYITEDDLRFLNNNIE